MEIFSPQYGFGSDVYIIVVDRKCYILFVLTFPCGSWNFVFGLKLSFAFYIDKKY